MAKFKVLLTMTETAELEFNADSAEQAIQFARETMDVDFDLAACTYAIVDEPADCTCCWHYRGTLECNGEDCQQCANCGAA